MTETVNWTTVGTEVPANTVPGGFVVSVMDVSGAIVQTQIAAVGAVSADLAVTAPGSYTVSVHAIDNSNPPVMLGALGVSDPFVLTAPATITVQTVGTVTVTVNP